MDNFNKIESDSHANTSSHSQEDIKDTKLEDLSVWQKKTVYETLGVSNTATADEIKNAWRTLTKKYHPDRVPQDTPLAENYTQITKIINEAWNTLNDPKKKEIHDKENSPRMKQYIEAAESFTKRYQAEFSKGTSPSLVIDDMLKAVNMWFDLGAPEDLFNAKINEIITWRFRELMRGFKTPGWGEKKLDSMKPPQEVASPLIIFFHDFERKLKQDLKPKLIGTAEKDQILKYFDLYIKTLPPIERSLAANNSRIEELLGSPDRKELINRAQQL